VLQKLITKSHTKTLQTFLKFTLNGLLATFVHYVSMLLISNYVIAIYSIAYGIAAIFGILTSFLGNKFLVFTNSNQDSFKNNGTSKQLRSFLLLYGLIMLICSILMGVLSDLLHINYKLSFMISLGVQTLLSFFGNKNYVFKG
jgi:putative flippase GtrA